MIVFYDGECGFCNRSVQLILQKQKDASTFQFVSLQSDMCKELLGKYNYPMPDMSSILVLDGEEITNKSTAALKIASHLKGGYQLMVVFKILPKAFRDWFYDRIAKRRHQLAKSFCYQPTEEERHQFL